MNKNRLLWGAILYLICTLTQTSQASASFPEQKQLIMNCDYKIPVSAATVDQSLILNWAKQAVIQSFDFNFSAVETQLQALQPCYTEKGWIEFKNALSKSGNLEMIKTKQLTMSGELDGQAQVIQAQNDLWKIILPLKVAYQNHKETAVHFLTIYLTMGRKVTGGFGIMQVIAIPRFAPQKYTSIEETAKEILTVATINSPKTLQRFIASLWTVQTQLIKANDKNKLTQSLDVNLTTDRKNTRDLEAPQVIAGRPTASLSAGNPVIPSPKPNQTSPETDKLIIPRPVTINCDYKIPVDNKAIDQELILTWAEQATNRSFKFDHEAIDAQLDQLQSCYTEKGWIEFKEALVKSGNIVAIKTLKLMMSSQVNGKALLLESSDQQWKVRLPLRVIYQNNQKTVSQLLTINLTIGRKLTGEFGIAHLVATLDGVSWLSIADQFS